MHAPLTVGKCSRVVLALQHHLQTILSASLCCSKHQSKALILCLNFMLPFWRLDYKTLMCTWRCIYKRCSNPELLQRRVIQIVNMQFLPGKKEAWRNKLLQVNTNKAFVYFDVLFDKASLEGCVWILGGILLSRHVGKIGFAI